MLIDIRNSRLRLLHKIEHLNMDKLMTDKKCLKLSALVKNDFKRTVQVFGMKMLQMILCSTLVNILTTKYAFKTIYPKNKYP